MTVVAVTDVRKDKRDVQAIGHLMYASLAGTEMRHLHFKTGTAGGALELGVLACLGAVLACGSSRVSAVQDVCNVYNSIEHTTDRRSGRQADAHTHTYKLTHAYTHTQIQRHPCTEQGNEGNQIFQIFFDGKQSLLQGT